MRLRIKNQKDFLAGLLFIAAGAGAAAYAGGQGPRIASGHFPVVLGLLLAAVGAAIGLGALRHETTEDETPAPLAWRPLGLVLAAIALGGMLLGGLPALGLPSLGLVPATLGLVGVVSLADRGFGLRDALLLAAVLAAAGWLIFVVLLGLPLPLWPAFLRG